MLTPAKLALRAKPITYWIIAFLVITYSCVSIVFFTAWVNPSLQGKTSQHIAADSTTYIYMADVLREHRSEPWVYASLAHFPNTLWMPVFIAYVLNSTALTAVLDGVLFCLSVVLFRRTLPINTAQFVLLLLLNPTTLVSLLSVNKEILDLLILALFCCFLGTKRKLCLFAACILALLNRYEVLVAFLLFLALRTRLNPWRNRRWLTLCLLLVAFSAVLPLFISHLSRGYLALAEGGGMVTLLDQLETHFLFFIAAVPKIAENLFGELLNPTRYQKYDLEDVANSYILLLNNLATAILFCLLMMRRRLGFRCIRSEWMYLAALLSVIMSISLVIQPRYFYVVYVLLSLEAARRPHGSAERLEPHSLSAEGIVNV